MRSLLYNLRSRSVKGIRDNFHTYYTGNLSCPLKCLQGPLDSQEHLLFCDKVTSLLSDSQKLLLGKVKYNDLFGTVEEQATVTSVFLILLRIRFKLLETDQRLACEGNNTRPHGQDILFVCFQSGNITTIIPTVKLVIFLSQGRCFRTVCLVSFVCIAHISFGQSINGH